MNDNPSDPPNPDFQPINRQKISDQVFAQLWNLIASGDLQPGDVVPSERVLMEKFGVGRPAIREAMQALAQKGVIRVAQGERSRVSELSAASIVDQVDNAAKLLLSSKPANLEHLKQLRKILEVGTVGIVAGLCTPNDARSLNRLIETQRDALGNAQAFIEADIAFHAALGALTQNPLIEATTRAMLTWLKEYHRPVLHWSGREDTTLQEHTQLVACLGARDSAGAVAIISKHLDRSALLYVAKAS